MLVHSTAWVQTLGFEHARDRLSEALPRRVVGTIYDLDSPNAWRLSRRRRYDRIALDVARRKPTRWLAVDDDALGWLANEQESLALVPAERGLACREAQVLLRSRLAARFS
jgi:hypothetical protein